MRTFLILLFVLTMSFSVPLFSVAQTGTGPQAQTGQNTGTGPPAVTSPTANQQGGSSITLLNPLKSGISLQKFLEDILALVVRIGTVVVILMMVYVGFLFVAARGQPAKIEEARKALLWTVVGALILLGAQAIAIGIKATVDAISVGQ